MPYIIEGRRIAMDDDNTPETCGELNYVITIILIEKESVKNKIVKIRGEIVWYLYGDSINYARLNEVAGAADCAIREYMRRKNVTEKDKLVRKFRKMQTWFYAEYCAPYEDQKIEQNGDVY